MKTQKFNENWLFYQEGSDDKVHVTLPHDAMLHGERNAGSPGKDANGYFVGGVYVYEKSFLVPNEWSEKHIRLAFGGVYRNVVVYLNGKEIGHRPYGYIPFTVSLDSGLRYGKENTIKVVADNSKLPNSRWYSGGGIYRNVLLVVGGKEHIDWQGVKIDTVSLEPATIRIRTDIKATTDNLDVEAQIWFQNELVRTGLGTDITMEIPEAKLWSAEKPNMYCCKVFLKKGEKILDEAEETFGIRKLEWSPKGFFVNGKSILLKGACVHHDNGILGACSYLKSEERKVRILKDNGFNALRISHNPASDELLNACDKYGMYVMDESFDMWFTNKNKFDYASDFEEWYKIDTLAMVERDYNHPSVIMYSIGNEVTEPAKEKGMKVAREMIDLVHKHDSGRAVTAGINLMLLMMSSKGKGAYDEGGIAKANADKAVSEASKKKPKKEKMSGSLLFNTIMSVAGKGMNRAANSAAADRACSPILDALDIAGYNYASGRYEKDGKLHPDRIIVGTETFPQDIADNWEMVKKFPYLIGDFMWTGWDYLGEAVLGAWNYEGASMANVHYPWLLSNAGAIDILGRVGAEAKYAACIWETDKTPYIGVQPVNHPGIRVSKAVWRGTNAFDSWSWRNCDGNNGVIEIYANADTAALFLNNNLVGKKKLKKSKAVFKTKYHSGVLSVITYDSDGREIGRNQLESATGELSLRLSLEDEAIAAGDIGYISVEVVGENGIIESNADRKISIQVENGELLGFGSAKPNPVESYVGTECETYYGQAQAVIRGIKPGMVKVTVADNNGHSVSKKIEVI